MTKAKIFLWCIFFILFCSLIDATRSHHKAPKAHKTHLHKAPKAHKDGSSHLPKTPKAPKVGSHLPEIDSQSPQVGSQLPGVGSQPPQDGSQLPGVGSQPPQVGSQLPGVGSQPPPVAANGAVQIFDVTKYYHEPSQEEQEEDEDYVPGSYYDAFAEVWDKACRQSTGFVKILVPKGNFLLTPIMFSGPCTSAKPIIFEVEGTVIAPTNPSLFPNGEWITFSDIDSLVLNGNGVFDGQGGVVDPETKVSAWGTNDCKRNKNCQPPSSNLRFERVHNSIVTGITSLNSKWFHYHVFMCNNFTATDLHITAPGDSPNTDGMHLSGSNLVNVANTIISTGDDCISVGQGCSNINIHNVTCGPGHGISVGSLGKERDDKSVEGVTVTDCTFFNTTNGARIKTWIGQAPGEAKNIIYDNLIMNNVKNPVVIDQSYGSKTKRAPSTSFWKISDVHFKRIRGTTVSNIAVSLQCSTREPCEGVEVADIGLSYSGPSKNTTLASSCANGKVTFGGKLTVGTCH